MGTTPTKDKSNHGQKHGTSETAEQAVEQRGPVIGEDQNVWGRETADGRGSQAEDGRHVQPAVEPQDELGSRQESEEAAQRVLKQPQIGMPCVFRLQRKIYAAIITGHNGADKVDLVYFQGTGSGHVSGATHVKKGVGDGQWWYDEATVRAGMDLIG